MIIIFVYIVNKEKIKLNIFKILIVLNHVIIKLIIKLQFMINIVLFVKMKILIYMKKKIFVF